jgi:hypothetical protein
MNEGGFVFPTSISEEEMELCTKDMHLTDSVFTKHETLYEIADGTSWMFTVYKTPHDAAAGKSIVDGEVKMEYNETVGGPRVVSEAMKKHTATFESAASAKTTSSKLRKASGGRIFKSLYFSGQRTTIPVSPCVRALT